MSLEEKLAKLEEYAAEIESQEVTLEKSLEIFDRFDRTSKEVDR